MIREVISMPITMADIGALVEIKRITGTDEVKHHLRELGFIEGEQVVVVSKNGGDVIINVKDSRIALNQQLANRIFI